MSARNFAAKSWAFIRQKPIESITLLLSIISFVWLLFMNSTIWTAASLRSLVEAEAAAAAKKDPVRAASLFTPDATIFEWQTRSNWNGTAEIHERYNSLPTFKWLVHVNLDIEDIQLISGTARAKSTTEGVMLDNGAQVLLSGDIWEFRKVHGVPFLPWTGEWRISSFTFDVPQ